MHISKRRLEVSQASQIPFLESIAKLYGVQTSYYDINGIEQTASVEALLMVLRSLGAPVTTPADILPALREHQQIMGSQLVDPVIVNWNEIPLQIKMQLPESISEAPLYGHLKLETGESVDWEWRGADLPAVRSVELERTRYVEKSFPVPVKLPYGYHRFILEVSGKTAESLIISAPVTAYLPTEGQERIWGLFSPLYALRTDKNWGAGDFSDLNALVEWVSTMGGGAVGTLPLQATFLDGIFEPSPYVPASRLFWNEFYLDINRIPELKECLPAQALLVSSQSDIENLRRATLVDYRRLMALKRQILEELCRYLFTTSSQRLKELRHFADTNPPVEDYARFRATCEKQRTPWQSWSKSLRDGLLTEGDYDEAVKRYHLYVQWLSSQQTQTLSGNAHAKGVNLYLDLPLGVHPDGYDVWRENRVFANGISVGSPPDTFFTKGQNWGFPPLHPQIIREQGYHYFIRYLQHHLQHSDILRIDHVMGMHRLFWIPLGLEAKQGLYVRYHADEFYAILSLESHRNKVIIVGEDLGTVPPDVRPAMSRHGFSRMYVVNFELTTDPEAAFNQVPPDSVASLGTHDLSPFAGFWQGMDIKKYLELGFHDRQDAQKEHNARNAIKEALPTFLRHKGLMAGDKTDIADIMKSCLIFLAESQAWMMMVNLEDLWLETAPQNMPGTQTEYPNWRRKTRYSLEEFCQMPEAIDILKEINYSRKK